MGTRIFSDEEKDILQEIMNIAFGNATAELSQVIEIYVILDVPQIEVIRVYELPGYLESSIEESGRIAMIEQKFHGDFSGTGLLGIPSAWGKELSTMFENSEQESPTNGQIEDTMTSEMFAEIGNILLGACVGKISELLETFATYSPPQSISDQQNGIGYGFLVDYFGPEQTAIVMKTTFTLEQENVNGFLLLITSHKSIVWLKKALKAFLESYE